MPASTSTSSNRWIAPSFCARSRVISRNSMRIQLALDPVAAFAVGEPLRAAGHDVTEVEDPRTLAPQPGEAVFLGGRDTAALCRVVRDAGAHAIVVSPDEDERAAARGA